MSTSNKLTLLVLAAGMGSRYGGIKQIDGLVAKRRNHYGLFYTMQCVQDLQRWFYSS